MTGLVPGQAYTFSVVASNVKGDSAPSDPSAVFTVSTDTTPPAVTGILNPAANSAGWNNGTVTVSWSVTDADNPATDVTVPDPFTLVTEGKDQVVYSGPACDPAGNCATGTATVSIDATPPLIRASTDRSPNAGGWFSGPVTVSFTCSDALSGIAVCPAPVTVGTDGGDQLMTGIATDVAGNSAVAAVTVSIDSFAPTLTAVPNPAANAAGWNDSPVTVSWVASDAMGPASTPSPVTVSTEGKDQLVASGASCDQADNCATGSTKVSTDLTAPTITGQVVNADGSARAPESGSWYRSAVRVHWTCSDALSGIAVCPADSYLSQDGTGLSATGVAEDVAGNTAVGRVSELSIDSTAPASSVATPCGTTTYCSSASVTVTLAATDAGSGVASIHAVVAGGADHVFPGSSGTFAVDLGTGSGQRVVTYWAVDVAGNGRCQIVCVSGRVGS